MKKVLCYGDSNTFGYNPKNGKRFDKNIRWSGILKSNLIDKYEVIEAGMNNRVGFLNSPCGFEYSAINHLPKLLEDYSEIDFLILSVGTNDLQYAYNASLETIEQGLLKLINLVKNKCKRILIIAPVVLDEKILQGNFSCMFNNTSVNKSKNLPQIYKKIAEITECYYFDFNEITQPSDIDGLHYDENSHKIIAETLSKFLLQ